MARTGRRPAARSIRLLRFGRCLAIGLAAAGWSSATSARAQTVAFAGTQSLSSGSVQDRTWEHTVPAGGVDPYLVVGVSIEHGSRQPEVQSLTFAGLALTRLSAANHDGQVRVEIWGLATPPDGTHPVGLRLDRPGGFVAGAASFVGVAPATSTRLAGFAAGSGDTATWSVPGGAGERLVSVYGSTGFQAPQAAVPATLHWSNRSMLAGGGASQPGDDNPTVSWSGGILSSWVVSAVFLLPSGNPGFDAGPDAIPGGDGGGGDAPTVGSDGGAVDGDAGAGGDAGPATDAGPAGDGGPAGDAEPASDAGTGGGSLDGGPASDGAAADLDSPASAAPDAAGPPMDGLPAADGGVLAPGQQQVDLDVGCGCRAPGSPPGDSGGSAALAGMVLVGAWAGRRRLRTRVPGR